MNLSMTIKIAWKNIVSNRLRSGLTILGLVIGIASVIILVGIGNGASKAVQSQVASLGTDIITVQISDSDSGLSYEDVTALESVEGVSEASPYQMMSATLSSGGDTSARAGVYAAGASLTSMMGYDLKSGRELSRIDVDNSSKVVIIGSDVASEFWGALDPCGDEIRINGDSYTVIGVLESVGSSMGNNVDEAVLIPITTAKYLGVSTSITNIYVRADSEAVAETAAANIENYLTGTLGISEDYVSASTQAMMLEAMEDINNTLSLLLGGIAGISLLVGGIGVMNVMLVSVTERTREIGIRKSLGASTGISNGSYIEIKSGLKEGDTVMVTVSEDSSSSQWGGFPGGGGPDMGNMPGGGPQGGGDRSGGSRQNCSGSGN